MGLADGLRLAPLSLQTLEDPLSQFMLHPILVREFPYLADESEVH